MGPGGTRSLIGPAPVAERTPSGVRLPPPGCWRAGCFLGFDPAARWDATGRPRHARWWEDVVWGGARRLGGATLIEATAGMIAGPGAGKTLGWLVPLILTAQWPGPVVVASTRLDLAGATAPARSRLGSVSVLDWRGPLARASGLPRVRWSLLDGCADAGIALDRAEQLVDTVELGSQRDKPIWRSGATNVVGLWLHAAALEGAGVDRIVQWARAEDLQEPQRVLTAHGSRAGFGAAAAALMGAAGETRAGVIATASPALAAVVTDPAVLDGCTPGAGDGLDLDKFLAAAHTLYLCDRATGTVSKCAPLTVALVSALVERAEHRADASLHHRCDPPLLIVLDEIANISPLPGLVSLLSQARGHGITVVWAAQSWSQLTERWGVAGAAAIWDTTAYRQVGAGLRDMAFLTDISTSLGERSAWRPSVSESSGHGAAARGGRSKSYTLMETPYITASHLTRLPPGAAVLLGREGWRVVRLPPAPTIEPFRTMASWPLTPADPDRDRAAHPETVRGWPASRPPLRARLARWWGG
ncbi:MAG TPA: TraM recognition domain-containing protein [Verrucomicrobiae bacterium]|nr:TraM recognition domain-containing protein [Verrucomicrobiae bacterium]